MVDVNVIETGSSGNCTIYDKTVMVDCGISYKKVQPFIGDLKLVLLTHVHSDHFKVSTIRRMALERPKLRIACCGWLAKPLADGNVPKHQVIVMKPNFIYDFGICHVIPVEVEHDVPNVAYKILFPSCKVFYATDCVNLRGIIAKNFDMYCVEANFTKEELKARMDAKKEAGLYPYEQRVMRCHMSKEDCDDWLVRNMGPNSQYMYMHCHVDKGEP